MENFLKEHLALINKNLIMTVSIGSSSANNIFNKSHTKDSIDRLLNNLSKHKHKITHSNSIKEYKHNNSIYIKCNNSLDYYRYSHKNILHTNNLYFEIIQIQKDCFIPESLTEFNSIEEYDRMTININNSFDINIKDYSEYYTVDIALKKPVPTNLLLTVLHDLKSN